jgi:hypothetical protein
MRKTLLLLTILTVPLAACMQDPASRGLAGAAAGAVLADATENDVLTGALIGGRRDLRCRSGAAALLLI